MTECKIVGLVGPSAVGKGFSKDAIKTNFPDVFDEPVVVTTRPKRLTDGVDRRAGIPVDEFLSMRDSGVVIFAHQPFGEGTDWYGFNRESLDFNTKSLLTEVHTDNVIPFKERFGDKIQLIALVADNDYLEKNIRARVTEEECEIQLRLKMAISEVEKIRELQSRDFIDYVIEVGGKNRARLGQIVTNLTSEILK